MEAELPSGYWQKVPIYVLSYEAVHFWLHLLKVKVAVENFKTLSGSFPIFAFSNLTTFSHTQTGAAVPIRISYFFLIILLHDFLKNLAVKNTVV